MKKLTLDRIWGWLRDPFDQDKIRKHEDVLSDIQRTITLTQETKTSITSSHHRFPVGHMIGNVHTNPAHKRSRRA